MWLKDFKIETAFALPLLGGYLPPFPFSVTVEVDKVSKGLYRLGCAHHLKDENPPRLVGDNHILAAKSFPWLTLFWTEHPKRRIFDFGCVCLCVFFVPGKCQFVSFLRLQVHSFSTVFPKFTIQKLSHLVNLIWKPPVPVTKVLSMKNIAPPLNSYNFSDPANWDTLNWEPKLRFVFKYTTWSSLGYFAFRDWSWQVHLFKQIYIYKFLLPQKWTWHQNIIQKTDVFKMLPLVQGQSDGQVWKFWNSHGSGRA